MSPSFLTSSRSKRSLRSFSRTRGTISRSANSRAVLRISRCSSVSSKSIMRSRTLPGACTLAHGRMVRGGRGNPRGDSPMSIRATKPALDEEEELRRQVEQFLVVAHELPPLSAFDRIDVVERITAFLAEVLLPHADVEQRVLYPQAALLLNEPDESNDVAGDRIAVRELLAQLVAADPAD